MQSLDSPRSLLVAILTILVGVPLGARTGKGGEPGEPSGQRRSVTASVQHAVGKGVGILAEKVPGEFTIPPGFKAIRFKYSFGDPRTGFETDRLSGSNIYAVTQRRYITQAANNPDLELPAGKYRFVVGGSPGAAGTLAFTLVRLEEDRDPRATDDNRAERTIDVVTWLPEHPEVKTRATYHVTGTRVTGVLDFLYDAIETEHFRAEPQRHRGTFVGAIANNVISGTWKIDMSPHRCIITGSDGHSFDRQDWGSLTSETQTTLAPDGTLTETIKGSGVSEWKWGASAPATIANKHESRGYEFTVPGEHLPSPVQGTWTQRARETR